MKTEKNILIAFILNLLFSVFEFIGGTVTGSVAIVSDAIHDMGDSLSIGISYFLEKKSKKKPDEKYTYGYIRYSIIGSIITTVILLCGSVVVIYNAIIRIINPIVAINYDGMIIFAVVGVVINFFAAYFTRRGDSLNQKAVNLHMLEDVLGWLIVLIGSIIMKFTDLVIIDSILSIIVALFILIHSIKNLKVAVDLFLEKTPADINISELKEHLLKIENVYDVHHIHIWSIDGYNNYATMHVVTDKNNKEIKEKIREELKEHKIHHVTIEIETKNENCNALDCEIDSNLSSNNIHIHHNHHH